MTTSIVMRAAAAVVALVLSVGIAQSARAADPSDSLDRYMRARMQKAGVPGAQVAVVRGGTIVALRSYGLANTKQRISVDDTTAFSVASITKAFVGVAAMQLVEQGKLDLSAPIDRYVEDLPSAWRAVTVRQLFNNVSGLPDLFGNYNVIAQDEAEAWARVTAMPMQVQPGERFQYTQTNCVLLGRILGKLSGMPVTDFVVENQLNVVGMRRTVFAGSTDSPPHSASRYTYYQINGADIRRTSTLQERWEDFPKWFAPCNGLMSTAGDLARWIIALQKQQVLKNPSSLATLWTPGVLSNGAQSTGFGGFLNGYALGWETITRRRHRAVAAIGGERSAFFIYPDDDLAVVVLTNLMGSEPEGWVDGIAALYFSREPVGAQRQ